MPTTRTASYARILGVIKGVSEALIPSVKFVAATWDQLSLETIESTEQVLIGLEEGYQLSRDAIDDNSDRATIILDIGLRDDYDSDSVNQYNLLASAEVIAEQLLQELDAVKSDYGVQFSNITKIPFYKKLGLNVSGIAMQMEVVVSTCLPFTWGDLSEFSGEVGRNISPFEWSNYTTS